MTRTTSETSTIREHLQRVSRHRTMALAIALIVLCAAVPFIFALPPLYRASTTVLIEGSLPGIGPERGASEMEARLQAIKQEAFSRQRLLELVDRFNLYPGLRSRPQEVVLGQIEKDIRIDVLSTEQNAAAVAFVLSYTARDAQTAAAVANTLASYYVERNASIREQQTSETTKALDAQIAETQKRLDEQANRLSSFAARSGAMPQQVLANISALQNYNIQLQQNSDAIFKLNEQRQALRARIADAKSQPADPATNPVAASLAAKQKELADLISGGGTDAHPDVRRLRREIGTLQKDVGSARSGAANTTLTTLQTSLQDTERRIAELENDRRTLTSRIGTLDARVNAGSANEPQVLQLNREYAATRDSLDLLMKQRDQAKLNERAVTGQGAEAFRVVDPAVPPGGAIGPNRIRLLAVACLAAIVLGLGAAFLRDRMDTSFNSIDELRAFTRVPVLASIPKIATRRDSRVKWAKASVAAAGSLVVLVAVAAVAMRVADGNEALARLLLRMG
jgi:polysaccharide chain length determinant protein (PEP-CTERM system associated)